MLIIDSIIYNGDPIIELRLEYLFNIVDVFLIIEAGYTFTGIKKEFYFEKYSSIFDKYRSKIIFIKISHFPQEFNSDFLEYNNMYDNDKQLFYFNECYQRNYIKTFLIQNIKCQYICIISDCDEIPSIQSINIIKNNYELFNKPVYLSMDLFYYNFKWKTNDKWIHSICINNIGIQDINISYVRNIINNDLLIINDAGWHLKYFTNIINISNNLQLFSYKENNFIDYNINIYHINKYINEGIILLNNKKLIEYDISKLSKLFQNYHDKLINEQKYLFTNKLDYDKWNNILDKFKNNSNLEFLDIGCNEGQTSIWLLENILTHHTSKLTCIDPFKDVYDYFIFNLFNFKNKINIIINNTKEALKQLSLYNLEKYDFIYINNDNLFIINIILSFDLLKKDGILLFNNIIDYKNDIDLFLSINKNNIDIICHENQIAIIKK